jgi:hypothetical protein
MNPTSAKKKIVEMGSDPQAEIEERFQMYAGFIQTIIVVLLTYSLPGISLKAPLPILLLQHPLTGEGSCSLQPIW